MLRRTFLTTAALGLALLAVSAAAEDKPTRPGPTESGFLLPNGWTITPAGKQVPLSDLPLNIVPLADGKHASSPPAVSTSISSSSSISKR